MSSWQRGASLALLAPCLLLQGSIFLPLLAARQALSEQAGGRFLWQLPVSSLVSPGVLALSPLSVYSPRSPDTSRAVETPARVQQSQTSNHISRYREREKADTECREVPWGRCRWHRWRVRESDLCGVIWPTTQVALAGSSSGEHCHPLTKPARGQAQQQTAVTFSLGKLPA